MSFKRRIRNYILGFIIVSVSVMGETTTPLTVEEQTKRYIKIMPAILMLLNDNTPLSNNDVPLIIDGTPTKASNVNDIYTFLPTLNVSLDGVTFSIENKPSWAEFNSTNGLLSGIPDAEGNYTDITILVSDEKNTTYSMEPFTIEVLPAKDLAYLYGKATQGTGVDYGYYSAPEKVIDHNDTTYNETRDDPAENWWQVELPPHTEVSKIVVLTRDVWYRDLGGAKLYLSETPYQNGDTLNEADLVATFDEGPGPFIFDFDPKKSGTYVIIKQLDDNSYDDILNIVSVEVYGTAVAEPILTTESQNLVISGASIVGDIVTSFTAIDYQNDPLSFSVIGNVPFSIDSDGTLHVDGTLDQSHYTFDVQVSDGINSTTLTLSIDVTAKDVIEQVLTGGDVTAIAVTEKDLVDAARDEISILRNGNPLLQTIYGDGNISYAPGNYYSQLITINGDPKNTFPIIYGNGGRILAVAGKKELSNFSIFASNPFYYFDNGTQLSYEPYMQRILAWLTDTLDDSNQSITVALSFVPASIAVESWITTHNTSWNLITCNETATLESCYNNADLVILGNSGNSEDANALRTQLPTLLQNGKPILYVHPDWGENDLSTLIENTFNISFPYAGNYWADDSASWESAAQMQAAYYATSSYNSIDTLLAHFQQKDYAFDWSRCKKDDGTYGEQYDDCSEVEGLNLEFFDGSNEVRSIFQNFDNDKKNLFDLQNYQWDEYKLYKLLALLGDKLRQTVVYPMDKVATDQQQFFRSLYADASIYSYRTINPLQPDMGNFSRSDFSHITPTTIERTLTSKVPFRSAAVYVLPGKTVTITRTDNDNNVTTQVYLNAIREGATHIFQENQYNRPKYLSSTYFDIVPGESITFTHPYGGRVLINFNSNEHNVSFRFENVAQHPVWAYWMSDAEKSQFEADMTEGAFEWAEVITPNFELHSKLDKMRTSIANEKWGNNLDTFIDAINRYTSNYPNSLAGYKGNGINEITEVNNFANEHNLTIYESDFVKHMNADQANCGSGCSGNPYDAYWAFDPVGHGDIHEIGHGLEKYLFQFEGWNYHSSTNPYSYYTKSIFNQDHEVSGITTECQNLPFDTLFNALKGSQSAVDVRAYMQENLWANSSWNHQVLFEIEAMMLAQYMNKFENGWHLLTNLHILERDRARIKADWENLKSTIGFDSYTLDEFNAITNNDWLIVSYSFAAKIDFRPFFDMYGITYSQKANDQVASFGYIAAEKRFFVSTPNGYCTKDAYGDYLNKQILDLNETFPY